MNEASSQRTLYNFIIFGTLILVGLYFVSFYNYLLFHSLIEIFSVIVACSIFIVAWNSQKFLDNNYLLFVGVAYLFVGVLDLIHTLAYKGMGIFISYNANLPTQLWIVSRYIESISLFIAPLFLHRRINVDFLLSVYLVISALLLFSIFAGAFPNCFIEGVGLTTFKKVSEYIISLILIGSIVVLFKERKGFEKSVFIRLVTSIALTICAELVFTFYISVYGFSNLVGHYLKLISFYFIYIAMIETGLKKPYDLLFKRTFDLLNTNLKKTEADLRLERKNLQDASDEIRILRKILPICSKCKKLRNDKEYIDKLNKYIKEHSYTEFRVSICPDCLKQHDTELGTTEWTEQ